MTAPPPKPPPAVPTKTRSGTDIKPLYSAPTENGAHDDAARLGAPGEFPFTRGIYSTMYRTKLWTMRQYAGFGTPRETNQRFRYLLDEGQTGLSVALDLPTQLGFDSDAPEAMGEVGRVGVAIDSLADMEAIFDGIPLDKVTTSFTINATAPILLAMYQAVAQKQGVEPKAIAGTVQNDLLKEFGSRGAWVFPIDPSMRLVVDIIEYCAKHLPRFNPISIASHYRDAGATPAEEAAYTLSAGLSYVDACLARGLTIDQFAPRLSFFWYTYTNFFEEVAKYRAARRIWAKRIRDTYAGNEKSQRLRCACVCGGHSLTKQEPLNNITRTTIETMAVAMSGLQSVFTAAYDEAFAIPTELAAKTALRVQQIVAYETDVASTVDPLAGSYFVEALTDDMEREITKVMDQVAERGGMVECLRAGSVQQQIGLRAYEWQRDVEAGKRTIVGVNEFVTDEPAKEVAIHRVPVRVEKEQRLRLEKIRQERDQEKASRAIERLLVAAKGSDNLMPYVVEAVQAYATVGEITSTLRRVFGTYTPPRM